MDIDAALAGLKLAPECSDNVKRAPSGFLDRIKAEAAAKMEIFA